MQMEWTLEKSEYCENIFLPRLGKEGQQYCEGSYWTQGLISHFTNSSRFIFSPFFFASLLIFATSPTPWLYDHCWGLIHIAFTLLSQLLVHKYGHNENFLLLFQVAAIAANKHKNLNEFLKEVWQKSAIGQPINPIFRSTCPTSETVQGRVSLTGRSAWSPINNVNSIPHGD